MDQTQTKPKLAYFQHKYQENLPEFLLIHNQDHVSCLSHFFEVLLFNEDCDYKAICDKHQPELALFESGVTHRTCRRLEIKNICAYPEIPKLGLHNADAWCWSRAGFLSDMDHWGIETFFSICTTAHEHMPELGGKLFVWPNFINPELHRDYGERKIIPILFTGRTSSLYPWRRGIYNIVEKYYPSLTCPHFGYAARAAVGQVMYGERYSRLINATYVVPTCGTIAKEVVRKHFEIPGCKSCLITEKSPGLEAAGFADMENCVFADEGDVLDKLDYLFGNPDALERITNAGHQLVHARHTLRERNQIFQWFELHKKLQPGQRIVQAGPFDSLIVAEESSGIEDVHLVADGLHLKLLRQGDERLWVGEYEEAEQAYLRCLNHIGWMPEPKFRAGLCKLYQGDAKAGLWWMGRLNQETLAEYKAIDPDPVEWAYFIISVVCLGKLDEASMHASRFPSLRHPELDRIRWVLSLLKNKGKTPRYVHDGSLKHRSSIHQLPSRSLDEWVEQVCIMLKACRQDSFAEALKEHISDPAVCSQEGDANLVCNTAVLVKPEGESRKKRVKKYRFVFDRKDALGVLDIGRIGYKQLRRSLAQCLHRLEAKFGYFLPYDLSEMRGDEFFQAIRNLAREEDIKTAVVIGAAIGEGSTEAFLKGIRENLNKPSVFCINGTTRRFVKLQRIFADDSVVSCYRISSSRERFSDELEGTVRRIKREKQITYFDAVLIDSSEVSDEITANVHLKDVLHGAKFVLLDDINSFCNYQNRRRLLTDANYVLFAENPDLRKGYAIFRRTSTEDLAVDRVEEQELEVGRWRGTARVASEM
jgi:hypothetical protein